MVVDWFGFIGCGGFDDFSGLEVSGFDNFFGLVFSSGFDDFFMLEVLVEDRDFV